MPEPPYSAAGTPPGAGSSCKITFERLTVYLDKKLASEILLLLTWQICLNLTDGFEHMESGGFSEPSHIIVERPSGMRVAAHVHHQIPNVIKERYYYLRPKGYSLHRPDCCKGLKTTFRVFRPGFSNQNAGMQTFCHFVPNLITIPDVHTFPLQP
jgi:hypothetical protein